MAIKFTTDKKHAIRFKVEMKGDVQTYALNWLKICNTVKSERELLKAYNDYDNGVYVICEKSVAEATKDWLEWFGEVDEGREILCLVPVIDDMALTEKEWDALADAEMLPVEEF